MIGWLLTQLIETVGGWISEICNWAMARIASEGLVIFDEPVIKAIIEKIYVIGLGLWGKLLYRNGAKSKKTHFHVFYVVLGVHLQ